MEKLPAELIFVIARDVVDAMAFPICQLREVSRAFRDIFSPYQYLRVVVYGPWDLESMVKGMLKCSPENRRMEHLFISDRGPTFAPPSRETPNKSSVFSRLVKGVRKIGAPLNDQEGERVSLFQELLDTVCHLSGSTLISLTIYFGLTQRPRPHWTWRRHHFPQLKTLSICYCSPGQGLIPSIPPNATPNIEEMRISVVPDFSRASHLIDCLRGSAPQNTIPLLILEGLPCAEMNELIQAFFHCGFPPEDFQREWKMAALRIHALQLPLHYQDEAARQAMLVQAETLKIAMHSNVRVLQHVCLVLW
jgi:hypothetical protein